MPCYKIEFYKRYYKDGQLHRSFVQDVEVSYVAPITRAKLDELEANVADGLKDLQWSNKAVNIDSNVYELKRVDI